MPKCLILLNHSPTEEQLTDIKQRFKAEPIATPSEIKALWAQIPPEGESVDLSPVTDWIAREAKSGDVVWVQGEFGATFYIADYCMKNQLIPVYATTKRIAKEQKEADGTIKRTHLFRHVGFRVYKGVV